MDFQKNWEKALKKTEIIRSRVKGLSATDATKVPYVFLAESSINLGDTLVRKGEVVVDKPALMLPPNNPVFNGFEFESQDSAFFQENSLINFLLVRGISIPSMNYDNKVDSLEVFEGGLAKAIKHYQENFMKEENVRTGLFTGPEDCWQFSLLIFTCTQIMRNAKSDIQKLMDEYRDKEN